MWIKQITYIPTEEKKVTEDIALKGMITCEDLIQNKFLHC